jgi:hypothetical protein
MAARAQAAITAIGAVARRAGVHPVAAVIPPAAAQPEAGSQNFRRLLQFVPIYFRVQQRILGRIIASGGNMINKGYFLIADITGYTAFMTGSELDHAQDILKTLFDTLHDNIKPPLTISNYQGDAILSYVPQSSLLQGQTLLEWIENIYCAFALTLENMRRHTTCTCRACANMQTLDLKMFVHHGDYAMQDMRGKQELSGADVIVVHRMTKNKVKEQTSVKAYTLFTEAATDAMGLKEFAAAEMLPHSESYEHIGDVNMRVYDLHKVLERERAARHVALQSDEVLIKSETFLPVPESVAWDYISEPEHFRRWCRADSLYVSERKNGRTGPGSVHHCAHGKMNLRQTVVGWKPFDFMTLETTLPFDGLCVTSVQLKPVPSGTQLAFTIGKKMRWPNAPKALVGNMMIRMMRGQFQKDLTEACGVVQQMIADDLKSGKLVVNAEAAETSTDAA